MKFELHVPEVMPNNLYNNDEPSYFVRKGTTGCQSWQTEEKCLTSRFPPTFTYDTRATIFSGPDAVPAIYRQTKFQASYPPVASSMGNSK